MDRKVSTSIPYIKGYRVMKLAVFGCSHTGVGPRKWNQTWPYHLYEATKLVINNFAIGGTSTQFQYDLFKKNIDNFDKFIFQFTVPYRLTKQTGPIRQEESETYTYFSNMTGNLERNTAGKFNREYEKWIKKDTGNIIKEYTNICKKIKSHNKCLFAFYMFMNDTNVKGTAVLQEKFPNIVYNNDPRHSKSRHLSNEENKIIAAYIKEKCKL
jgi:hypothetical protein